jgi:hypothetical protein
LPSAEQTLERQSAPLPLHGPSPLTYPHLPSASHAPLRQTTPAFALVHEPSPLP